MGSRLLAEGPRLLPSARKADRNGLRAATSAFECSRVLSHLPAIRTSWWAMASFLLRRCPSETAIRALPLFVKGPGCSTPVFPCIGGLTEMPSIYGTRRNRSRPANEHETSKAFLLPDVARSHSVRVPRTENGVTLGSSSALQAAEHSIWDLSKGLSSLTKPASARPPRLDGVGRGREDAAVSIGALVDQPFLYTSSPV